MAEESQSAVRSSLTDEQRNTLEKKLVEERQRVAERAGRLDDDIAQADEDGDITLYPVHLADEGTDTMEQETDLLMRSRDGQHMALIDNALRKIYKEPERYGICENCGREIPYERLGLCPWDRFCRDCVTGSDQPGE